MVITSQTAPRPMASSTCRNGARTTASTSVASAAVRADGRRSQAIQVCATSSVMELDSSTTMGADQLSAISPASSANSRRTPCAGSSPGSAPPSGISQE